MKKIKSSTTGFQRFWRDRNSVLRMVFFLTFSLLFVATLFYGYFRYVNQVEEELSGEINAILSEITPQNQVGFDFEKGIEGSGVDKERLSDASAKLYRIYLDNPSRKNGVRALLHRSLLLWRMGDDQAAEDSLTKIREEYPKSLFAPTAMYALALIFEENGDYEKANEVLDEFVTRYPANFLLGEALLAQGRILVQLQRFQQAYEVYQKLLEGEELSSYSSRADIELSYLESIGYGIDISDTSLGEDFEQTLENPEETVETEAAETEEAQEDLGADEDLETNKSSDY